MISDDEAFWQLCQIEDPEEREGKLHDLCRDDGQRKRLTKLLEDCREADRLFGVLDSAESHPSAVTPRPLLETPSHADAISETFRSSPWDVKGPTSIGPYELIRLVGRGGMGIVFQARDPTLLRDVALNIPRVEVILLPRTEHRFVREARAAARLNHPSLVSILQVGAHDPYPFIASEWCDGGARSSQARRYPPSFRQQATAARSADNPRAMPPA